MRLKMGGAKGPVFLHPRRGQSLALATEWAHLLRLVRYPPTITEFHGKPQAFYLRFCFCVIRRGWGQRPKRSRWAHFVADGSRGSPRKAKMTRFPLSTGDQGLLRIWCHFKTMPDYGAKAEALIHTPNY